MPLPRDRGVSCRSRRLHWRQRLGGGDALQRRFRGWRFESLANTRRRDAQVTVYAGNHSLRLTRQETATTTVNTDGYATVSISASFAAYRLGLHDTCVAEWSLDDGKTWKAVTTVRPGQDDGISLRRGVANKIALNHAPHVLVRLRSQLSDANAACWGDNVSVVAERG